jgi:single-stranded-DNA-specific exonuclease
VLELLVTENPLRARELAEYLDSVNRDRSNGQRNLQEKVFARLEAEGGGDGRTVVLAGEHWPKGLLGLVASRVAEQARKPTMLISIDGELATGSGRSAAGFDLYTALTHARDHCISMGGHSEAAGLRLRPENIPAFRVAFEEGASLQPEPPEEDELEVDLECALDDLVPLRGSFSDLEPFGQAHPAPVAVVRNVEVKDAGPSRNNGDRNATFHVTDGLQIYTIPAFDMSPRLPEVTKFMDLALVYTGSHWGVRDPGWKLLDFKRPGESRCPWGEGRDVTIELTSARGDGRIGSASYRAAKPGQNVEGSTDRTRPDGREGGGA